MTTNKHHNGTLIEKLKENIDKVESLRSREHSKDATEDWKHIMDSHWDVELWLLTEVIKPALEEALINQELKNF